MSIKSSKLFSTTLFFVLVENLSCLQQQLSSTTIISIVQVLKDAKSASINEFTNLVNDVEVLLIEANSNITYLNLFIDYCGDFEIPIGIDDYTMKILLLIKFVSIESKYYKSL